MVTDWRSQVTKSIQAKVSQPKIVQKQTKCIENFKNYPLYQPMGQVLFYLMSMYNHRSRSCRNWPNQTMKLTHHIRHTSDQQIIISLRTLIGSYKKCSSQFICCNFFSRKFISSRTLEFYATKINKLTSCWQKCIDSNGWSFDLFILLETEVYAIKIQSYKTPLFSYL